MIEIKTENGKTTWVKQGDSNDIMLDLSLIVDAVLEEIYADFGSSKGEALELMYKAMKNTLYINK